MEGSMRARRRNFVETANTIGLPRYAKQVDQQFARWVMLHESTLPCRSAPGRKC